MPTVIFPISIHALLAESDSFLWKSLCKRAKISIHALLAESDRSNFRPISLALLFLSTLSLRRATQARLDDSKRSRFLSTLSLRRATVKIGSSTLSQSISIHALLAESDIARRKIAPFVNDFYPRSPCGERPGKIRIFDDIFYFYPRSPCGERLTFRLVLP